MTIFAIIITRTDPSFGGQIASAFPDDFFQVSSTNYLVSATGTAKDVSDKLGLSEGTNGSGIVLATSGYYGRAPTNIWEWMKAKLEGGSTTSE